MAHPKKQGQNLLQEVNDLDSFSDSSSDISSDSSNDLAAYREFIEEKKPSLSKVEEAVDRVLTPSSPKDWHEIRFFARVSLWSQRMGSQSLSIRLLGLKPATFTDKWE